MIKSKVWGNTEQLFNQNNVEIHRIEIKKGGYCSRHYHDFKYNMFYVENGVLEVSVLENDSNIINSSTLYKGQSTVVEPKKVHIFLAKEDTIAYEIYWVSLQCEDIIRQTYGGVKKIEDSIYSGRFFRRRVRKYHKAEMNYAEIMYDIFKPTIVYDVGCGLGSYLLGFKNRGCKVLGYDKYMDVAKKYCDEKIVNNLVTHDACVPFKVDNMSDMTLCIEVAEHIPPLDSQNLVRNICDISRKHIIFTAAKPGQRGTGHINCRRIEYWMALFTSFGFSYHRNKTLKLKESLNKIEDPLNLVDNMIVLERSEPL